MRATPFSIKIRARWIVEKKFVRNEGYYRSPNFHHSSPIFSTKISIS